MKRTTRKHLKEDQFQKFITRFLDAIKKFKREIFMAAAGVAFILVIFAGAQIINSLSLNKQNAVLYRIKNLSAELEEKPENLQELEKIAGNGKFVRLAYVELAKYWFERGDFAKSQSYLEKVEGNRDLFYYQAQDLLGQTFLNQKEFTKAIDLYKAMEDKKPDNYPLDAVLAHLAEAYEGMGQREEALALYKRLQEEYAQTYYGYDAAAKIRELEQKK